MKTKTQKARDIKIELDKLYKEYRMISTDYNQLLFKKLTTENIQEHTLLQFIIKELEDIRKNGGSYSSVKAVEILYALGQLK